MPALVPGTKEWQALLNKDFPKMRVNTRAREITKIASNRFRGGVRISTGRFKTGDEYEDDRRKQLNTPLP